MTSNYLIEKNFILSKLFWVIKMGLEEVVKNLKPTFIINKLLNFIPAEKKEF